MSRYSLHSEFYIRFAYNFSIVSCRGKIKVTAESPQVPTYHGLKISYADEEEELPNPTYHVTDFKYVYNASKSVDETSGTISEIFGDFRMPNEEILPRTEVPLQTFR